jgi:hypothetical protein
LMAGTTGHDPPEGPFFDLVQSLRDGEAFLAQSDGGYTKYK